MTWAQSAPTLLVLAVAVLAPGAAMGAALGLRGPVLFGLAPSLSMTALAGGAVLAPMLGLAWTPVTALAATAAAVAASVVLAAGVRRAAGPASPAPGIAVRGGSHRTTDRFALAAALAAGVVIGVAAAVAMRVPDELVDSPDAVFHVNRLRVYLDGGNASSLLFGYPSGFHDLAAIAIQVTHPPIIAAVNLTSLAVAAIAWPLGVLALASRVLGSSRFVLAAAALASTSLTAMPYLLMGWGVLWPNVLGAAVLPGAVAALALARRGDPSQRRAAALGLVVAIPGLALAHPNTLAGLLVFGGTWLVTALARRAWSAHGRTRGAALAQLGVVVGGGLAALVLLPRLSPLLAATATYVWRTDPLNLSVRDILLGSLQLGPRIAVTVVAALGVGYVVARRRSHLWVVVAMGVCVLLYVLAASTTGPVTSALTGFWYNDKVRLAVLAAVPLTVLVTAGLVGVRGWLVQVLASRTRRPVSVATARGAAVVVLATFVLAGGSPHDGARLLERYYWPDVVDHTIASAQDRADLVRLAELVPSTAIVAGDPSNGSALLYALTGRTVLTPGLGPSADPDVVLIGQHLKELATRADVCPAVRRTGARYAVDAAPQYWGRNEAATVGIVGLIGVTGLTEVGRAGRYTLFEITGCAGPS
ncbi:MAG TPA: DUF6541 family protein [Candidatus Lustribacter sp.]|nr:DUF6541 family protein [Candidatus Lustribacter sp.]